MPFSCCDNCLFHTNREMGFARLHQGFVFSEEASPCDICGDNGVIEAIITCCECKISRQHLYCMRVLMTEVPLFWSCEECDRKKLFSPTRNNKQDISKDSTQKVSSFEQKSSRVSDVPKKNALGSRFNFKETRVHTGRTKYLSCEEAVKLSSGANKSEHHSRNDFHSTHRSLKSMPPPHKRALVRSPQQERSTKFESHLQQPVIQQSPGLKAENSVMPLQNRGDATQSFKPIKSSRRVERTNIEREMKTSDPGRHMEGPKSSKKLEKTNTKASIQMAKSKVLSPTNEEVKIKGHIEVPKVSKELEKTSTKEGNKNHDNMEAESSGEQNVTTCVPVPVPVSEKNYTSIPALHSYWKGSFNLPNGHENLNGEFKAHPPSSVHNKVFETLKKLPENQYFELIPKHQVWMEIFPGCCPDKDDIGLYFFPRSDKGTSLIDFLWSKNLVMKSHVDEVELLVLPSRFLQPHCQEFEGNYFLWGVFYSPNKIKKGISLTSKVAHETLVQRVKCEPCDDFPPGFEKKCKPFRG